MHLGLHTLFIVACFLIMTSCSEKPTTASDQLGITSDKTKRVFNAHMHAARLGMDDAIYRETVLAEMDGNNIEKSVLHISEPGDIEDWVLAAPDRFLAGPVFPCWTNENGTRSSCDWDGGNWPDLDWLRTQYESGVLKVMGEMFFVYAGIAPDDSRMDPYWALAEELDIPVAVHINRGPPPDTPSRPAGCCPDYNAGLGNPALLRPVLEKHPKLRIWLQHAGFPAMPMFDDIDYLEETYALMQDYPSVYADMTALNSVPPSFVHEAAVKDFLERGFIDRLMMGTDNWEASPIITRYEGFEFLSDEQKRGILYENASRFFRLKESE